MSALTLASQVLLAVVPTPRALPPQEPAEEALAAAAQAAQRKGPELDLEAGVRTVYSSNPFHYSDADLDGFDSEQGPGQRFDGLESEWDLITTLSLESSIRFPLDERRDLKLSLEGARNLFLQNAIADYSELEARAVYDFTRRDRGSLEVERTFDRFKKNYKLPSGQFEAAHYDQLALTLEYERELTKRWSGGLGLELSDREFDDDFSARDRKGVSAFTFAEVELTSDTSFLLEVRYGEFDTDTEMRAGLEIDRSFDTWTFSPELKTELGAWDVGLGLDYRLKDYTTDESGDGARFGREDQRLGARLKARRKLSIDGGEMFFLLGWRQNKADPDTSTIPPDETSYDEYMLGFGLSLSLGPRAWD